MHFTHKPISKFIFSLFFLPIAVYASKTALDLRSSASGTPANIVVKTSQTQGNLPTSLWQNYAQGGEEPSDMIGPLVRQISLLQPKLIRIDHLYDYFGVYLGPNQYDFSRLDKVIDSIEATGATPLLSVSYTPASMSKNGQVAGEPTDYNLWYNLVKATAKRYSLEKNIPGIYYEVGNEPDLFGGWHYAKSPNYLQLYNVTSKAIVEGAGTAFYKIGGPATTAYYDNWAKSLLAYVNTNNLRLDFLSWHDYKKDPLDFEKNIEKANALLSQYPKYNSIERLITELGINSEPDKSYDTNVSAIHTLATITRLAGKVHRIFHFELVDGQTVRPDGSSGWGLLTHPSQGAKPKPRYDALVFANKLTGQRLALDGEGSWVSALASKTPTSFQLLLVNYDYKSSHDETFPVSFQELTPGNYEIKTANLNGQINTKEQQITGNNLTFDQYLETNSAVLIELRPILPPRP